MKNFINHYYYSNMEPNLEGFFSDTKDAVSSPLSQVRLHVQSVSLLECAP